MPLYFSKLAEEEGLYASLVSGRPGLVSAGMSLVFNGPIRSKRIVSV